MRRRFAWALGAATALAVPSATASTAVMTRYFDDLARAAYEQGEPAEALQAFLLVDALTPTPLSAFNVGLVADLAKERELSFAYLSRYLASSDADPGRRDEATRRMAALRRRLALVRVETTPPGATVYVDRRALGAYGVTPTTIVVEAGEHTLELEHPDFLVGKAGTRARKGAESKVELALVPRVGSLDVTASARGTLAAEDAAGKQHVLELGKRAELPVGKYRVRLEAPRYRPEEAEVVIREGLVASVVLAPTPLPPPTGRLLVTTGKIRAQVHVDGKVRSSTPATIGRLGVGDHEVEVRAPGYQTWRQRVTIREEKAVFVEPKLVRGAP
ncbi:MAG: PEGA domain-containing protein [Polyangiaceae bacterium]|nr:PEGA domain-containing protein [Polyangiaceae bacterium]